MIRTNISILICLVGLCVSARAWSEDADTLYRRGVELRRANLDRDALEVFRKLNEVEASPRAKGQLALAEQAVGLWVEAESDLQAALRTPDDSWIKKNQKTLSAALTEIQSRLGKIEIWGEPAGAEVLIDGKRVGQLPLSAPVRVVAGSIPVTVRAQGYTERTKVIVVSTSGTAREQFALNRVDAGTPSGSREIQVRPASGSIESTPGLSAGATARSSDDAAPQESANRLRPAAKWIAFGAGALALAVGAYGTSRQIGQGKDFNTSCFVDASGNSKASPGVSKTDSQCRDLKSNADSGFRLEIGGFIAAGALIGAGVALWLTEPGRGAHGGTASACAPGLTDRASPTVWCSFSF